MIKVYIDDELFTKFDTEEEYWKWYCNTSLGFLIEHDYKAINGQGEIIYQI